MVDTKVNVVIKGDSKSFVKANENALKKLEYTRRKAKETNQEIKGLGNGFTRAANNVAIFNGQLDPIAGRLSAIGTGITRFGAANIALGTAVATLTIGVGKSVSALENYEQRQNRFNSVLRSTGFAARLTRKDLEELSQSTARSTLGGVDEIAEAIVALTTFRNVQAETFKDTVRLAADARIAFGGNLREGIVAFGKALNDPSANLGALSRKGIQFTDVQADMIKSLQESGRLFEAQTIIVQELRDQFGGLATDEAPALKSAMDATGQSIQNMWEGLGQSAGGSFVRDQLVFAVEVWGEIADKIANAHTEEKVALAKNNRLREDQAYRLSEINRLTAKHAELTERGFSTEAKNKVLVRLDREKQRYENVTQAIYEYNNAREYSTATDNVIASRGLAKTLAGELSAIQAQTTKVKGELKKRSISLISGVEDEKVKVKRVNAEKTADHLATYNNLVEVTKREEKKQIELIEQGITVREDKYKKEVQLIKQRWNNPELLSSIPPSRYSEIEANKTAEIEEVRLRTLAKNDKARIEITKVKNETIAKLDQAAVDKKALIAQAEAGVTAKLAAIDKKRAAAATAKELRDKRALKVAQSAHRKRMKFLDEISAGSSKLKQLEYAYADDVEKLATAEFTKTEYADAGVTSRAELVAKYVQLLKANYDKDVKEFKAAEASKEAAALDRAGRESARSFKADLDLNLTGLDAKDSGVESFFGVDINQYQEELAAVETAYAIHKAKIAAMDVSYDEKKRRLADVTTAYKTEKAETEKDAKTKTEADTWNAINTLGASGSRKSFAIAKALNMAKVVMKTAENVTEAMPNIPLAVLMAASGAVQLNTIRQQPMPQFHDGIDYVPREGSYLLDKGERVVDSRLNADLKTYLGKDNRGETQSATNINFTIQAGDVSGFDNWYANNRQSIINDVQYGMSS